MRSLPLALAILLTLATAPAAIAHHADELPRIAGGSGAGAGWAAMRFSAGTGEVTFDAYSTGITNVCLDGIAIYDSNGNVVGGHIGQGAGASTDVFVDITVPLAGDVHGSLMSQPAAGECGGFDYINVPGFTSGAGTYTVVLFMGGGSGFWWELRGDAQPLAPPTQGAAAFAKASDLRGGAVVNAAAVGAEAAGALTTTSTHTPMDIVFTSATRADVITRSGPEGSADCTLGCTDVALHGGLAPGDHSYTLSGAGSDALGETTIFFADVQAP